MSARSLLSRCMAGAVMVEAVITDEMMAAMRAKAGTHLRIDHSVNNEEVTKLAIAKFTAGIGDPNPLWTDRAHATASAYGRPVAPPSFVIAAFSGLQFGWPGLGSFHSRSAAEFHRPVFLGDRIEADCVYQGFDGPRASTFAERIVVDHFVNRYRNQHGELVATIEWSVINYERGRAKQKSTRDASSAPTLPHRWSLDELEAIEAAVLAEQPRGATPRWWEDVAVGHELDPVVKGPIGLTDEVAFLTGGGAPIPRLAAHRVALQQYRRHPAWAFRDPTTGALEPIYAVHYNRHAANAMGVPLQYDVGFQRQCWHVHLLTDWMGDDGWLRSSEAEYRRFVYHGDVVRLGGVVTAKHLDDVGDAVVEVRTWARNQRGEDVMPGRAVVALPSRERGDRPVTHRAESEGRCR